MKSCANGAYVTRLSVENTRCYARVVQGLTSRSGQYVCLLNSSNRNELVPRIAVYRGPRFLEVRTDEVVFARLEPLRRLLLLARGRRAELLPLIRCSFGGSDEDAHVDRLHVLVLLACGAVESGLVGTILGYLHRDVAQKVAAKYDAQI
eukprot:625588-Prymnesium_polylepis.1